MVDKIPGIGIITSFVAEKIRRKFRNGNGETKYSQNPDIPIGYNGTFKPSILQKGRNFVDAQAVKNRNIYPYFREINQKSGPEITLSDGRKVLMFASNSYLGLESHPEIKIAAKEAIEKYGTSSSGSRFINGNLSLHTHLEFEIAKFLGKEDSLVYSTGFQTNIGVISTLVSSKEEYIILDKEDHASIQEGAQLSLGKLRRYNHEDMSHLERILSQLPIEANKLLVVDGVFSMSGEIVNLPHVYALANKYNAALMIDDAHGLGVIGRLGRGTANHFDMDEQAHLIAGTFSKSLVGLGGFVASDKETIDYLRHHSKALIFSASMSPPNAAATLKALEIMQREPERIESLKENTKKMKEGLESLGYNLGKTKSPILPVYIEGRREDAFRFSKDLENEGVFATPVIPPAVPEGQAIIRVSMMANHTDEQISKALDAFKKVGKNRGII